MYNFQLQANGLDERFNQTLQSMLVKFVAEKQKHWDDFLDTCTFAYNTSVHESALFHTNCVSPSPAALNNTEQPWYCVDCM